MTTHTRYQMHCQYCHQRFESESLEGALVLTLEHEKLHPVSRAVTMEDFYESSR